MARPRTERTDLNLTEFHFTSPQRKSLGALRAFLRQISAPRFSDDVRRDDRLFAMFVDLATNEYGLTQASLARELGMSPATLARWAKGSHLPSGITRGPVVDTVVRMLEPHAAAQERAVVPRGRLAN